MGFQIQGGREGKGLSLKQRARCHLPNIHQYFILPYLGFRTTSVGNVIAVKWHHVTKHIC